MTELTDYEINRRLAEVAGHPFVPIAPGSEHMTPAWRQGAPWSPLTDWRQLGPLMERERVWTSDGYPEDPKMFRASCAPHMNSAIAESHDLKRAICLAIIAAHDQ